MDFRSETFAAIGAKFCTKYAKMSQKFQFLLPFLMCEANQSARGKWPRAARAADVKGQSGMRR